jgi:DNA repair exonuclease SbcCD ATPase subunit
MNKKYWLGPGLFGDIKPDGRIPEDALGKMSEARLKDFEAKGMIGNAPRAAAMAMAANNATKRVKELEAKAAELEELLENASGDKSKELAAALKERDQLKKERDDLFESLQKTTDDHNSALELIKTREQELKLVVKDRDKLKKELAALQKSHDKLRAALDKSKGG